MSGANRYKRVSHVKLYGITEEQTHHQTFIKGFCKESGTGAMINVGNADTSNTQDMMRLFDAHCCNRRHVNEIKLDL